VTWKAFAGALVALVVGFSPLPAQPSATAGDDGTVAVVASGTGVLAGDGAETSLPWIETAGGPLVALVPLAARLGGELTAGAFGSSYELALGDAVFVVAADSPAVTRGTEILPLSQPPRVYLGAFFVPLDLVPRTWGAVAGVQASWDAGARRLNVHRPSERALAVDISVVHLQGVSTVVLRFPDTPRVRIEPHSDGFDVVAIGDRFVAPPERALDDPFVRAVTVGGDRIRLYLAPGIDAEHYRLGSPDRIVFDLYRTQGAAVAPPARAPAERPGIRTVVIDPGHGGAETGATGPAGTMEKELTLLIARALAERLTTELGLRAVLTRGEDFDLDLDARSALANQNQADLFVSVHLNSAAHGDAHGAETYFLSLAASDQRASEVAALENVGAADGAGEFELRMMLWDLAQSRHLAASQRLATVIQEELNRQLELRDRGVKQAPFRVLMGAAMPAVLVELGFLSSAAEERRLRDPAYRAELVGTLVRAIARFRAEYEASLAAAGAAR
jgi:N-acetylmuramoyl-L-alanine amidase